MYRDCKMNVDKKSKKIVRELLAGCNLSCVHCFYNKLKMRSGGKTLSKQKAIILIDKAISWKIDKLVLTGGEPTIHPDFVEISNYALKRIPKVSLCTNGCFSLETLEDKVSKMDFSMYTVSIDSHLHEIHDKFRGKRGALKKTIKFLEKINQAGKNSSIHISIHPDNIYHIEETIDFCKRLSSEIVVASIYFFDKFADKKKLEEYKRNLELFKTRHIHDPKVILAGFYPDYFCTNKQCLDQKNIFMVNSAGDLVECYWKKNGGIVVAKNNNFIKYENI
jgi:MoaA/NifB/PqqE/SkfB family radical SAM enzyme